MAEFLGSTINFGSFSRTSPISEKWGYDRGTPIDRYYIESFLECNSASIRGRVMEIKDANYTTRFGGGEVTKSEILDVSPANKQATLIADLADRASLQPELFDCLILTQTLQFIADVHAAVSNFHFLLKPGGTLLLTCPGITRIETTGDESGWYWSFTAVSLEALFEQNFKAQEIAVQSHGNVFAACCFLQGMALEEVDRKKLDEVDGRYPLILTVKATKSVE
jgi:SAM-dependent methyltransferase